ncbi:MAG: type II toxin-antitoxin system VapC family toxin [Deltaproteobacteria bacterium]|nr:type II toxin-antitoxin system VapC family toxin [Deltaproteobacteria bacterium]
MVTKDVNFDRMIIATAQIHELVIITADEIFKA